MKKTYLILLVAGLSLSLFSCRETTEEKTEEAVESIGEDIEHNTRKAGEEIEEGAREVEREIEEETHGTDDEHMHQENDTIN